MIDEEKHEQHHSWLTVEIVRRETTEHQWTRVKWAIVTAVSVGAVMSLFSLLFWAFSVFVQRGGQ